MSVQTGAGPLRIDPDDAQFTYRGKTLALKIRVVVWPVIVGCVQSSDGTWAVAADLTNELFVSDVPGGGDVVEYWLRHYGSAPEFVRAVVIPELNKWLALLFPPVDAPLSAIEQIHFVMVGIKFAPQPDGTLKVTA